MLPNPMLQPVLQPVLQQEPLEQDESVELTATPAFNLNAMFADQIKGCKYFQQLMGEYQDFEAILNVIQEECTHLEPMEKGVKALIPSVAFCCLARLCLLKLTRDQLRHMLRSKESPFVRGVAFLYIRCLLSFNQLIPWITPFLTDQQMFVPFHDEREMSIAQYLQLLFTDHKYKGAVLRRLPVPISRDFERKTIELEVNRERKLRCLKVGAKVTALWNDGHYYDAIVDEVVSRGVYTVLYIDYDNTSAQVYVEDVEVPQELLDSAGPPGEERGSDRDRERSRRSRDPERDKPRKRSGSGERDRDAKRGKDHEGRERSKDRDRPRERSKDRERGREEVPGGGGGGRSMSVEEEVLMRLERKREKERSAACSSDGRYATRVTGYKRALGEMVETFDRPRFQSRNH